MNQLNEQCLHLIKREALVMPALRTLTLVALAASTVALAGCGTRPDSDLKTASINNDYRVRHPITLAEAEHSIDIPVATGDVKLSRGIEDTIRGFGQNYKNNSSGIIQIAVPVGSINSRAARAVVPAVRRELAYEGVQQRRMVVTSYQADPGVSAPIKLSFVALTAMTDQCGQWPEDLMENSFANKNWYNFGCANQNNLAAQVANPKDLFDPRASTPIDAQRRANVIDTYRTSGSSLGQDTSVSIPSQ
ncbi:pilus assembly protein CpaD [Ensifer adhaerens]|nr:pilus assembly protein CpaD [Ensifer adhaerens]HZG26826.1 CpaD family pilus assembly protein [Ensifer sp.]